MNVMVPNQSVYCSGCSHRADLPMSECDCLMCWRGTAEYLPGPGVVTEYTVEPLDLPPIPELEPLPGPGPSHEKFAEYVEAMLVMCPNDFDTHHNLIELFAASLYALLKVATSNEDQAERIIAAEKLKEEICNRLDEMCDTEDD